MIRIHDLKTAFDGLTALGIQFYADRALVLQGTAVIPDGPIDEHITYLADVGIGAREVIRLKGDVLVNGLMHQSSARDQVIALARGGVKMQFFNVTADEERLVNQLGLHWSDVYSAPAAITVEANDKVRIRRLGETLGVANAFPPYGVHPASDLRGIRETISRLFRSERCDFVVLKRPDLASGEGMIRVQSGPRWSQDVDAYVGDHAAASEIIVEAGFAHVPMSVQWEIDGTHERVVGVSQQLIDKSFLHRGNVIASSQLPDVRDGDVQTMQTISLPFVQHYRKQGYRGVCGFDFLRSTRDDRHYLLECNGRVTATTYAIGIGQQIASRLNTWAIAMSHVETSLSVRSFYHVVQRLGPLLFDGYKGALPFSIRCLQLGKPKLSLCAIGGDAEEATYILDQAKAKLA